MSTEETFDKITSELKWYCTVPSRTGYHNAQSANRLKARFRDGSLSEKTIEKLFNHFGYEKSKISWHKTK